MLDLPAETAYLSKLQVTVPLRRLENGHLALSLLDSEEDFPETDSWEVVSKELVLPPFARRQEKNRQKVLTFQLDQGEEAEALSTETPTSSCSTTSTPTSAGVSARVGRP